MAKTHDKKRDFIKIISSMTNTELNDYIKQYGSEPKPVVMCRIIDKSKRKEIDNLAEYNTKYNCIYFVPYMGGILL